MHARGIKGNIRLEPLLYTGNALMSEMFDLFVYVFGCFPTRKASFLEPLKNSINKHILSDVILMKNNLSGCYFDKNNLFGCHVDKKLLFQMLL